MHCSPAGRRWPCPECTADEKGERRPASGLQIPARGRKRPWAWEGFRRVSSLPHVQPGGALDPPPGRASPLEKGWDGRPPPRALGRRTPTGTSRSCNASFKSPVPSPGPCLPPDKDALQQEIKALKSTHCALDEEIAQLRAEGYSLEELESHIALLHEYNEIKDAGQMLLGRLALIRGVTTKELYPEFGLDLTD